MCNLFLRMHLPGVSAFSGISGLVVLFAVGFSSPASPREVKVPEPIFNASAVREFPQAIFDKITAKIGYQTTFDRFSPSGLIRWWPRTIKLVDFVKAPSRTYSDTYLFAMRYVVSVISEKVPLVIYTTSCQVLIVYKDKEWDEPTVVCEPVNLDQPDHPS
jgi:hypothetical protein